MTALLRLFTVLLYGLMLLQAEATLPTGVAGGYDSYVRAHRGGMRLRKRNLHSTSMSSRSNGCVKRYHRSKSSSKGKGKGKGSASSSSSTRKRRRRRMNRGNVFRMNRNANTGRRLGSSNSSSKSSSSSHERDYYYDDPECYDTGSPLTRFPTTVPLVTRFPTLNPEPTEAPPTMTPSTAPSVSPEINFRNGFPCDQLPFTINRDPPDKAYPQLIPLNDDSNLCYLRMTDDLDDTGLSATAFRNFRFDDDNPQRIFSMTIGYRVYGAENGAADGMAFTMHQDPRGLNAIGKDGGGLSIYADLEDGVPDAIQPALSIEWDTFENDDRFDDGFDNVHVLQVNQFGTVSELSETQNVPIRTDDAGTNTGRMWVDYCGDNVLRIFINNAGDTKPASPVSVVPFDFNSIFTGQNFVTGYGSSTGLEADYHDITSWDLQQSC